MQFPMCDFPPWAAKNRIENADYSRSLRDGLPTYALSRSYRQAEPALIGKRFARYMVLDGKSNGAIGLQSSSGRFFSRRLG